MGPRLVTTVLAAAALLCGCSAANDMPLAEAAIADFHAKLNAGQFGAIYGAGSDEMKRAAKEGELVQLLAAVQRKLGPFQSGKAVGWNDQFATGGHFMTIQYAATYARGAANETFVFRIGGDRAALAGYNINSTALVVS